MQPSESNHSNVSGKKEKNPEKSREFWRVVIDQNKEEHPSSANMDNRVGLRKEYDSFHRDGGSSKDKAVHRRSDKPITIAPRGPVTARDESDGYWFKCQEEGCNQWYRHRSSRSRHKKTCPHRNLHK